MLDLNGARLDMGGRTFTYDVPEPFGPDYGPASLTIVARPAATLNTSFKLAIDKMNREARVRDLTVAEAYAETKDIAAKVEAEDENLQWVQEELAAIYYDHCIVSWETDIQNANKNMEPTRDNFIALSKFPDVRIQSIIDRMRKDLSTYDKFSVAAARKAQEAETKN